MKNLKHYAGVALAKVANLIGITCMRYWYVPGSYQVYNYLGGKASSWMTPDFIFYICKTKLDEWQGTSAGMPNVIVTGDTHWDVADNISDQLGVTGCLQFNYNEEDAHSQWYETYGQYQ